MTVAYLGQYDDCGSRNTFYRLQNRRYGFKSFESKTHAEFAYRVQKHLATIDLAPRVYGEVGRIRIPVDVYTTELTDWGYLTEIAKPMKDCDEEECDGECSSYGDCNNYWIQQSVVECLEENGLSYVDAHRGNFGYVRRNRTWVPVVIDVGYESFEDFNPEIYGDDPFRDVDGDNSSNVCGCRFCVEARRYQDA